MPAITLVPDNQIEFLSKINYKADSFVQGITAVKGHVFNRQQFFAAFYYMNPELTIE